MIGSSIRIILNIMFADKKGLVGLILPSIVLSRSGISEYELQVSENCRVVILSLILYSQSKI